MDERRAMDADPHRDAEVAVEDRPDVLRVDARDVGRQDRHVVLDVRGAVERDAGRGREPVTQLRQEGHLAAMERLEAQPVDERHPQREPDHAEQVQRAQLEAERVRLGVDQAARAAARAAEPGRGDLDARAQHEPADPGRPVQRLVPGERQGVDPERRHVDRDMAGRLRRVDDQRHAPGRASPGDLRDRLHGPEDVRGVAHDDRPGVRADQGRDGVRVHEAAVVERREVVADRPSLREVVERAQHGVVVEAGGDEVVAGPDQPLDHGVQRVRRVGREHDPVRIGGAEEPRDSRPGVIDKVAGLHGQVVAAPAGRDPDPGVRVHHLPEHLGRLGEGGGGVVEVDAIGHGGRVRATRCTSSGWGVPPGGGRPSGCRRGTAAPARRG